MERLISLKLLLAFTTLGLFNLHANPEVITADAYIQAFRAIIRFNCFFLKKPNSAINNVIAHGINLMETDTQSQNPFFTLNHVETTTKRWKIYADPRAVKPETQSERSALRSEFIQKIPELKSFFTKFIDPLSKDSQISNTVLETLNQCERDFSPNIQ